MVAAIQFLYSTCPFGLATLLRRRQTARTSKTYITDSCQAKTIADVQAFQFYSSLAGVTNPSFYMMQQEEASTSDRSPKCFVIVHNVAKKHNIGTLTRSCTAFNVVQARLLLSVRCWLSSSWTFSRCTDVLGRLKALQYLRKSWLSCSCSPCILCYLG